MRRIKNTVNNSYCYKPQHNNDHQARIVSAMRSAQNAVSSSRSERHLQPSAPFTPLKIKTAAQAFMVSLAALSVLTPEVRHRAGPVYDKSHSGGLNTEKKVLPVSVAATGASSAGHLLPVMTGMALMAGATRSPGVSRAGGIAGGALLASLIPPATAEYSDFDFIEQIYDLVEPLLSYFSRTEQEIDRQTLSDNLEYIASSGDMSFIRRERIAEILEKGEIEIKHQPYHREWSMPALNPDDKDIKIEITGTNLIATPPGFDATRPTILLTAHLDKVAKGNGYLDNASGCASVVKILTYFSENPLASHNIQAVFFDGEEKGFEGSKEYVNKFITKDSCPSMVVNLDIIGHGDSVFVSSRERVSLLFPYDKNLPTKPHPNEEKFIGLLIDRAGNLSVINNGAAAQSDSATFNRLSCPAVGVSNMLKTDTEHLLKSQQKLMEMFRVDYPVIAEGEEGYEAAMEEFERVVNGLGDEAMDHTNRIELFQIIHTDKDQSDVVDHSLMYDTTNIIIDTLRAWSQKSNETQVN